MKSEEKKPKSGTCFWCGKPKKKDTQDNSQSETDREPPVCTDYIPCDDCRRHMNLGVAIMGSMEGPMQPGMPPILELPDGTALYPTGTMCVIRRDRFLPAFKGFLPEEELEKALKAGRLIMPESEVRHLIEQSKKTKKE